MAQTIFEQLQINISANDEQAKQVFQEVEKAMEGTKDKADEVTAANRNVSASNRTVASTGGSVVSSLAGMAAKYISLAVAARALVSVVREGLAAAEEERMGLVRLQSVLDSTGRSHEITAGRIDAMAQKLEDYAYQDKQAAMDAMARLATYDGIASSLFERILSSASDLSAAFGTDISSAISDLGRALEDPIEGLSRLRRQGIMVSSEVESQVTSLVEQNRLYDAQSLLLDEIDSKVGGVAEKMAEVAGGQGIAVMWDKFVGELGNTLSGGLLSSIQRGIAGAINGSTGYLEFRNSLRDLTSITAGQALSMDTGDLIDLMDRMEEIMGLSSSGYGMQSDTVLHVTQRALAESGILETIQAEVEARQALAQAEQSQAAAARNAAEERQAAEDRRVQQLEDQKALTEELGQLYASTEEGQIASLEARIAAIEEMRAADERYLASLMSVSSVDSEVYSQVEKRMSMYASVIGDLKEELEGLTAVPEVDTSTLAEKILGVSAEDYVLSIPVSFDFEGRDAAGQIEAQLSSLRSAINSLYSRKPSDELELEQWQSDMDTLVAKYRELSAEQTAMAEDAALRAEAESELAKLLSDEEEARQELIEYQERLNSLLDAKLITQEEYVALLEKERRELGLSSGELEGWDRVMADLNASFSDFLSTAFSIQNVSGELSDLFRDIGEAWASNTDAAGAAMQSFGDFAQELASQLSTLFIAAGLRCIAEMGYPGLFLGLSLIAAGGLSGIAAGLMGGTSAALDDSVLKAMEDEVEARQKLADSINESVDTEYDLLRRQLERNLISEETFRSEASELQHLRDVAEARAEISSAIYDRISELNSEYSGMSGWDKFWSGRDEEITRDIEKLQEYFTLAAAAGEDELRTLLESLAELEVSLGSVPSFANGGSFVTRGPQLIMVGDNASGRERVSITPLDGGYGADGQAVVININGGVYGIEDLYGKLQSAGLKLERRMR